MGEQFTQCLFEVLMSACQIRRSVGIRPDVSLARHFFNPERFKASVDCHVVGQAPSCFGRNAGFLDVEMRSCGFKARMA